jgi:hypothetical protein
VCRLHYCSPTDHVISDWWDRNNPNHLFTDQEHAFGDYSAGRYAWLLADVQALPEPVPCKGARLLWEPDTLTQMAVMRQLIGGVKV